MGRKKATETEIDRGQRVLIPALPFEARPSAATRAMLIRFFLRFPLDDEPHTPPDLTGRDQEHATTKLAG
jgi:hypothetical protein